MVIIVIHPVRHDKKSVACDSIAGHCFLVFPQSAYD